MYLVLVDQRVALLLEEERPGFGDRQFAAAGVLGHDFFEHPLQIEINLLHAHSGKHHGDGLLLDADLDAPLVELAGQELRPHLFPAALIAGRIVAVFVGLIGLGRGRDQQVQQPLLNALPGVVLDLFAFQIADQADGVFDQVANHALDIAAVIAHLGIFRGLDLDKRSAGELGQAARDFSFSHAGGADHHDVFRRHLVLHIVGQTLSAPAVANGDGHRPLGRVLAYDVAIQFGDNFPGSQLSHASSSTTMLELV